MSTTRIMLEEAEGAVKAAREAEQAALAQAATDKAAADRRAADATKAREDAEARFTELLSAEQAAIDARRARVFGPADPFGGVTKQLDSPPIHVETTANAA